MLSCKRFVNNLQIPLSSWWSHRLIIGIAFIDSTSVLHIYIKWLNFINYWLVSYWFYISRADHYHIIYIIYGTELYRILIYVHVAYHCHTIAALALHHHQVTDPSASKPISACGGEGEAWQAMYRAMAWRRCNYWAGRGIKRSPLDTNAPHPSLSGEFGNGGCRPAVCGWLWLFMKNWVFGASLRFGQEECLRSWNLRNYRVKTWWNSENDF